MWNSTVVTLLYNHMYFAIFELHCRQIHGEFAVFLNLPYFCAVLYKCTYVAMISFKQSLSNLGAHVSDAAVLSACAGHAVIKDSLSLAIRNHSTRSLVRWKPTKNVHPTRGQPWPPSIVAM